MPKSPENRPNFSSLAKLWDIPVVIICLTLLGYWLDGKFHTSGMLTLSGAFLGLLYCFYQIWQMYKKGNRL